MSKGLVATLVTERSLAMPMSQVVEIAFKVFNGRDQVQEQREQQRMKQATLLAAALTQGREGQN